MLYRKRNIDLPVSHFTLKQNLVTRKRSPGKPGWLGRTCLSMEQRLCFLLTSPDYDDLFVFIENHVLISVQYSQQDIYI